MNEPPPNKLVTAVIVTYESSRTIGKTLAAARKCYDQGLLDVVVVDNASSDDTRSILQNESRWIKVILSATNLGYGKGCNLGVAQAATPYTIFINPDAEIEPEELRKMLTFMETHPKVGILGPAIICGDENSFFSLFQHTGPFATPSTILADAIPFLNRTQNYWSIVPGSAPSRTGWVCGAILLTRTALLKTLGGFDPRFFLYWEETDLCKRAENLGFENWVLGTARARHVVGESSSDDDTRYGPCIAEHYYQSRFYYMVKHHGRTLATIAELGEFFFMLLRTLRNAMRGNGFSHIKPRMQTRLMSMPKREQIEH